MWRYYDEILWWQVDFGLRPSQTFWHLDNINILNLLFWLFATDYSISISFIGGGEMLNTASLKPSLWITNRYLFLDLWKGSKTLFFYVTSYVLFFGFFTKYFPHPKSFHLQLRRFSEVLSWEMVRKIVLPILIRTGKFIIFSLGLSVITFISKLFNLITFLSFKLVCISPKTFINQNFINSVLKPKKKQHPTCTKS